MTESPPLPDDLPASGYSSSGRLWLQARHLWESTLDLIFPPKCVFQCGRVGSLLCASCQATIVAPPPVRDANSPLQERRAAARFEGKVREMIHQFKYEGTRRYALPLAQLMATEYRRSNWTATMIIPVPLHESRLKERGYNQAGLLAKHLAQQIAIPAHPEVLKRIRATRQQVGLNAEDRQKNVEQAFEADARAVAGQSIVMIDDVYTTGATLKACAQALLAVGAKQIWGLTLARAGHR